MKTFLKMVLAVITGLIIASILFFIVTLSVFSGMAAAGRKQATISEKTVLVMKTGATIPDRSKGNPFTTLDPVTMSFTQTPGLNEILKNLKKAAKDRAGEAVNEEDFDRIEAELFKQFSAEPASEKPAGETVAEEPEADKKDNKKDKK